MQQSLTKAAEYSIPAVLYETGGAPLNEEFVSARAVLVATYAALSTEGAALGYAAQQTTSTRA